MRKTLVFLSVLWVCAALVGYWTPWSTELLPQMLTLLGVAGVFLVAFHLAANALLRKCKPAVLHAAPAGLLSRRPLIVFISTLFAIIVWIVLSSLLDTLIVTEVGIYLILFFSGLALSRWCGSGQYVPILTGALLLILMTSVEVIAFLLDPSAQYRLGPEIVIFAAGKVVGLMTMLPLDAVFVWGGWSIGEATKAEPHRPSDTPVKPDAHS